MGFFLERFQLESFHIPAHCNNNQSNQYCTCNLMSPRVQHGRHMVLIHIIADGIVIYDTHM